MVSSPDPTQSYIIKSGKRKGQSLAVMMFNNTSFLYWYYKELNKTTTTNSKKNKLHKQLEWLIQKGENRQTKRICPHCQKKTIKYYSIRSSLSGNSIAPQYTYCENCIPPKSSGLIIRPFKFSYLSKADKKGNGPFFKRLVQLYRWAFELPKRLTKDTAFKFFQN